MSEEIDITMPAAVKIGEVIQSRQLVDLRWNAEAELEAKYIEHYSESWSDHRVGFGGIREKWEVVPTQPKQPTRDFR